MCDQYPEEWIVLADKVYQVLDQKHRVITPIRNLPINGNNFLTKNHKRINKMIAADRVIVEKHLGKCKACGLLQIKIYMVGRRLRYVLYIMFNIH